MLASKGKISLRQAMIIFLVAAYSPTMRFVIASGAKEAKQAAWLSPFITFAITIPIIFISTAFTKNTQVNHLLRSWKISLE